MRLFPWQYQEPACPTQPIKHALANPRTPAAQCEPLEGRVLLAGDVVLQWNQVLSDAIRADQTNAGPTWASRNAAIMHAAVYDAVNGIAQMYEPYLVQQSAPPDASIDAAAASAAEHVLARLYPRQKNIFANELNNFLASIPDGPTEQRGIAWGRMVANRVLAARANDGANKKEDPYLPGTEPGDWQPTWPDYSPALGADWYNVNPFVMTSGTQFLPPPPPPMTSPEYTAAFNQVKELGGVDSATRTPEQTEIGLFWAYDRPEMGTPVILYNQITQSIAESQANTLVDNARLFALLNLAMADAGIVAWDAKYEYDFWRPITAIRNADADGNPQTIADPDWEPLGAPGGDAPNFTPNFPAYTSGHSTFGAAAFQVLSRFYEEQGQSAVPFTATSDELPGVTRSYDSFDEAAAENGISRIYLGIHWAFDNSWGLTTGKAVGNYVAEHILGLRDPQNPDPQDPDAQDPDEPAPPTQPLPSLSDRIPMVMPMAQLLSIRPLEHVADWVSDLPPVTG